MLEIYLWKSWYGVQRVSKQSVSISSTSKETPLLTGYPSGTHILLFFDQPEFIGPIDEHDVSDTLFMPDITNTAFVKVNIDTNSDLAREIKSIPSFKLIRSREDMYSTVGYNNVEIVQKIKTNLF